MLKDANTLNKAAGSANAIFIALHNNSGLCSIKVIVTLFVA